jgi:hypothetical protein
MSKKEVHSSIKTLVMSFLQALFENHLGLIHKYVKSHPELIQTVSGFLLDHEKLIIYVGRTHIGVEYIGSETLKELKGETKIKLQYHDYSTKDCNLLEQIIGFEYDSTMKLSMPLPPINEDLFVPTNRGWDKLTELRWNFAAQNSVMAFNTPCPEALEGQFTRIVNGIFFDANDSGLKTRRIKWLDLIPIHFDGSEKETDSISFSLDYMKDLVEHDAHYIYPMPQDYKFIQLPKINQFIEKWGNNENSETDITSFLAKTENEFILSMKFGAAEVYSELTCEWQSEDRKNIRPDFFIVQPNGYADVVEFKLPDISKKTIVGSNNRETFGAWLNAYISQTRVYSSYFDDPNNRKWFEDKYGFKVHKPRRVLVVGRRNDFDSDVWREIMHDYKDVDILTFDDLVDGVVVQFYKA